MFSSTTKYTQNMKIIVNSHFSLQNCVFLFYLKFSESVRFSIFNSIREIFFSFALNFEFN